MPRLLGVLAVWSALNLQHSTALAQGTAFTYQGRLAVGGNAATNGIYDFTFALFAINTGGSAVAGPVTNSAVGVSNGLFTTTVDLGANFPGADRWLELGARTNGGGAFTTLSPRQKVTATPYALLSVNAASAASVSGSVAAAQLTGTISPNNIGAESITSIMLAPDSVHSNHLAAGSIHSNHLAAGSVHSNALIAGSVTAVALADGSIHSNHLAAGSVHSNALIAGSVTAVALADGSIHSNHLAAGSVHSNALISGSVTAVALADGSIHSNHLAAGSVHSNALIAGSVTAVALSDGSIHSNHLAAGSIHSNAFALGSVSASALADGSIHSNHLVAGSIHSNALALGSVTALALADNSIHSNNLIAGSISPDKLISSVSGSFSTGINNPNTAFFDYFGGAVAAVGTDKLLIGAYQNSNAGDNAGAAYLLSTSGTLLRTFFSPAPQNQEHFGFAVASVGSDKVLIGADGNDTGASDAGAAYLLSTNGTLITTFTNPTPAASDFFGYTVAAVGSDKVLIGAYADHFGANVGGAAYLFSINGALLTTFNNPSPASGDRFGIALAAVGTDQVLIGADRDDSGATDAGVAYLFSINGALLTTFNNPTPAAGDSFGSAVAAVGVDKVLIGAPQDNSVGNAGGAAYLFNTSGTLLITLTNPTPASGDQFGLSVAVVDANNLVVGAPFDDSGATDAGAVYLFNNDGALLATWSNPAPANGDLFGNAVTGVGSDKVLIGASQDDVGATDSGAAYLFSLVSYTPGLVADTVKPGSISMSKLAQEVMDRLLPAGTVVAFAGSAAPAGWVLCDGSARNGTNATFSALFAAIGKTYGIGDGGSLSFNLPDLRGRTPIGSGLGLGLTINRTLAAKPGTETITQVPSHAHSVSLTTSSGGSHSHTILGRRTSGGTLDTLVGSGSTTLGSSAYDTLPSGTHTHSVSGNTAASGVSSVDNLQPSIVLNYIIKL